MEKRTGISPAALRALAEGDLNNYIIASTPGGIEAQERAGQATFARSETLPKDCPRLHLEHLGFVFGEDADDIFVYVTFPQGWSKRPTEHAMWTDLLDDKGRKRAGIFYKAAFYDRDAHMILDCRYTVTVWPHGGWQNDDQTDDWDAVLLDADEVVKILESQHLPKPPFRDSDEGRRAWAAWSDARDAMRKRAGKWLEESYPDCRNPLAYW